MIVMLLFCRIMGFFLFLPLGRGMSDMFVRVLLSFVCAYAQLPYIDASIKPGLEHYFIEFVIGVALSLPVFLLLEAVSTVCELFETGRGMTLAAAYDPSAMSSQTTLARLMRYGVWVLLLSFGGMEVLVSVLVKSFSVIEPAQPLFSVVGDATLEHVQVLIYFILEIFRKSFIFVLPFLLAFLLVDLIFGFLTKILPQLQTFTESFVCKTVLGYSLILLLLKLGVTASAKQFLVSYPVWAGIYG